jgi:hypothetical protein
MVVQKNYTTSEMKSQQVPNIDPFDIPFEDGPIDDETSLEIRRYYQAVVKPGQIVEIRCLDALMVGDNPTYNKPRVIAGWFDNVESIISEVRKIARAAGIYMTINPCLPDLLARANNQLKSGKLSTTSDNQIVVRQILPIDIDSVRLAGIPASNTEHQSALTLARTIRDTLKSEGWPDPINLNSGNGAYLEYAIALPTQDEGLIQRVLQGIANRFDTEQAHIDTTTYNPARIMRLPGTMNRKGDGTENRPHRMARIIHVPDAIQIVTREQLEAIAAPIEPPKQSKEKSSSNGNQQSLSGVDWLDKFIAKHNIQVKSSDLHNGDTRYKLVTCAWNPDHTDDCATLFVKPNGMLGANCNHSSCEGKGWKDFRRVFEPDFEKSKDNVKEVRDLVDKAIESGNTDAVYELAVKIVPLNAQERASVETVIKQNLKKLPGFSQRAFNSCLKEAEKEKKSQKRQEQRQEDGKKQQEKGQIEIILNTNQERVERNECIDALIKSNNPPVLFVQGNGLCQVLHEKYKREDIDGKEREYSRSSIERHSTTSMINRLLDICDFVNENINEDEDGEKITTYSPASPPNRLADLVLSYGYKPYPHIMGTVSVPILRPNGEICTEAGYDDRSQLWYAPSDDLANLSIPESPTREDAIKAIEVIDDILHDFCFASAKDKTHTFAALLTTFLRPIIGNIPLCLIDAPKQGTGKGLLSLIIVLIATLGSYANVVAPETNPKYPSEAENEWEKRIGAALMQGLPIVVIDNLTRGSKFTCKTLDSVLTKEEHSFRPLGTSSIVTVPSRAMWICNGNNITVVGDTARRTYHIRLDPKNSKPWLRKNFRYKDIVSTVKEKRGDVVTALLTIIRAWFVAGKPLAENSIRLGSFEQWSEVMGGILNFIGLEGFLGDMQEQEDNSQGDEEWTPFMEGWYNVMPNQARTIGDLYTFFVSMSDLLPPSLKGLASEPEAKFKNAFTKTLKKYNDVCFGKNNIRLEVRRDTNLNQDVWKVTKPEVNQEPEHTGGNHTSDPNTSGRNGQADLEPFSRGPEVNSAHVWEKENIFSSNGQNEEKNNLNSVYGSNTSSGTSGVPPVRPVEHAHGNQLGGSVPPVPPVYSGSGSTSGFRNSSTIVINLDNVPNVYCQLFSEYYEKVLSLASTTSIWRAPDSGFKNTMFGKLQHIKYTKSLLVSGDDRKVKGAIEAMKRTLGIWED